ncbi:MAG: glycosyltransferase [Desulfitobacteriaceae bacterium]
MTTDKILHLIGGEIIGGAELHVLNLLTNLNVKRFSPVLICLTKGSFASLAQEKGIFTTSFPMHHPLDLTLLPGLIKWIREQNISLLHTHGSRANLLGRLSAKFLGIPCVSTYHSSMSHDYLSPWSARLAISIDKLTLPLTAGIITISEHLNREVKARGGQRLKTIFNGYPQLTFSEPSTLRQQFRKHWNIPSEATVLGTIARLHPTKGHHYLIQAAARLKTKIPNLHLLLIGDGPLVKELELELYKEGLNYTLTGYLPQAYEALPAMDLFVLTSLSEGMGLVLLEAMQAHIPIVASAVGGIPELIRSGIDGLLVQVAAPDALEKACSSILENPQLAKALTDSAYQRWPQFSITKMLSETQNFYEQTLKLMHNA